MHPTCQNFKTMQPPAMCTALVTAVESARGCECLVLKCNPWASGEICVGSEMIRPALGPLRVIERVEDMGDIAGAAAATRQRSHDDAILEVQRSNRERTGARRSPPLLRACPRHQSDVRRHFATTPISDLHLHMQAWRDNDRQETANFKPMIFSEIQALVTFPFR